MATSSARAPLSPMRTRSLRHLLSRHHIPPLMLQLSHLSHITSSPLQISPVIAPRTRSEPARPPAPHARPRYRPALHIPPSSVLRPGPGPAVTGPATGCTWWESRSSGIRTAVGLSRRRLHRCRCAATMRRAAPASWTRAPDVRQELRQLLGRGAGARRRADRPPPGPPKLGHGGRRHLACARRRPGAGRPPTPRATPEPNCPRTSSTARSSPGHRRHRCAAERAMTGTALTSWNDDPARR